MPREGNPRTCSAKAEIGRTGHTMSSLKSPTPLARFPHHGYPRQPGRWHGDMNIGACLAKAMGGRHGQEASFRCPKVLTRYWISEEGRQAADDETVNRAGISSLWEQKRHRVSSGRDRQRSAPALTAFLAGRSVIVQPAKGQVHVVEFWPAPLIEGTSAVSTKYGPVKT